MSKDRDTNRYIKVPNNISDEQRDFLLTILKIYDAEKCAILACHTGNKSINNYAAENIYGMQGLQYSLGLFYKDLKIL